ncbi:hypothetical protein CBF34_07020 [Vagococcus penaei]|uniref:right-handed parallel beta-helix repeat-containing protein n=1 Tax=Vagococcus penaei TaxID=633807 RepID=UPI000F880A84|nr:right-handed parallel beta-helix repeat-containing protein [Vagococcus penaei]RSU01404.1 hypothetical protein CBF34_07020 [Vagococcus penaei]
MARREIPTNWNRKSIDAHNENYKELYNGFNQASSDVGKFKIDVENANKKADDANKKAENAEHIANEKGNEAINTVNDIKYTVDQSNKAANEAKKHAEDASLFAAKSERNADEARKNSEDTKDRIENLVLKQGENSTEVIDARKAQGLESFRTLSDRLDAQIGKNDEFRPKNVAVTGKLKSEFLSYGTVNADWFDIDRSGKRDSSVALNKAVDWMRQEFGYGTLILPSGTLKLVDKPIKWYSNLSVKGGGMGVSKIYMEGNIFNAIENVNAPSDGSQSNLEGYWLRNCMFSDFEIDGSGLTAKGPHVAGKGIFILYMKNARFRDLWIHDTIGTGLGADFLTSTVIDGVVAERCGRNLEGFGLGQSGIGIGTGTSDGAESISITNCICRDNGNYGIFVETQGSKVEKKPYGVRIIGNIATGNRIGIGNKGSGGAIIANNTTRENKYGIHLTEGSYEDIVTGNKIELNEESGLLVSLAYKGRTTITSNLIQKNRIGINLDVAHLGVDTLEDMLISSNNVRNNKQQAILSKIKLKNCNISGNQFIDNATENLPGNKQAISFEKPVFKTTVNNNNFSKDVNSKQIVGIEYKELSNGNTIIGNNFSDLTQELAIINSRLSENTLISNNLGLDADSKGTVKILGTLRYAMIKFPYQYSKIPNVIISTKSSEPIWIGNVDSLGCIVRTTSKEDIDVDWIAKI